ncbi:MAG: ATP-binding protein [Bryobacterales bacterium]|nr:ATP-binding protein [Bryobacteraceae bacterium]MDW8129845.1 ATP-binding protein [Bryobacterales bacterium]
MSDALRRELYRLRERLAVAEQALRAIREGEADAVLAAGPGGCRVFTLEGAEHPYRVFLEQMQEGAAALDSQGAILYANQRLAALLETPLEKVIGRSLENWVPAETRPEFRQWLDRALREGARAELDLAAASGRRVPVGLSGRSPGAGVVPALCVVVTDLSESRQREDQLRRQTELLARARAELERQTSELARSNAELEQFASVLAHDLREPLRAVLNYARLLSDRCADSLDDRARRYLGRVLGGAERLDRMIEGLLEFSRVTTRGRPPAPADAETVFVQACADLRELIESAGASVTHEPLPTVMADETQLLRLFENLLANAIKFRGAHPPRVHVWAEPRDGFWRFGVRDNGIGVEPRDQERIFAPFQRAHHGPQYPGEGLGLAVARRIVERHGGQIWVESRPGHGSTFFFTLPGAGQSAYEQARGARAG